MQVSLVPEEAGVESLAHQIKLTGRAYPLFDIAALILQRRERYHIEVTTKRDAEGKVAQPLFLCSLDNSVWFSEEEVAAHVLASHFDTLYQTEKVPTDPPKGTYTLVAQCPMSGVILGPPNLHDYNQKLRRLHSERFSRMPFEAYKARIKMVTEEAVVKQWVEEQSFKNEYTCLNVPEPVKFGTREEVEQHFRETHLPGLARSTDKHTFPGAGDWPAMPRTLKVLINRTTDEQRRFPLKVAMVLSQQFARHGLQFFKVNKTLTHVCVARPHFLDLENTVVSEGVRNIVDYIRAHEGCKRRELLEALAPTPPAPAEPVAVPAPAPAAEAPAPAPAATDGAEAGGDQSGVAAPASSVPPAEAGSDAPATEAPPAEARTSAPAPVQAAPAAPQPTAEQAAVIADLHWLIHQGHVIEFTSGRMELAKRPQPKPAPAKPKQKDRPKPAEPKAPDAGTPAGTAPETAATHPPSAPAGATDAPAASESGPVSEPAAPEPA
ncbi:MAG: hypothetical protein KDM81_15565, partial [Verrucomicrobiae bacterium]|nr:hypothetical protein [Verrucomicrobiae bacterium]